MFLYTFHQGVQQNLEIFSKLHLDIKSFWTCLGILILRRIYMSLKFSFISIFNLVCNYWQSFPVKVSIEQLLLLKEI